MTELGLRLAVSVAQIAAVMGIVMMTVMILTLAERKVLGLDAGPHGSDGSRPLRNAPTDRRRPEAVLQGRHRPGRRQ